MIIKIDSIVGAVLNLPANQFEFCWICFLFFNVDKAKYLSFSTDFYHLGYIGTISLEIRLELFLFFSFLGKVVDTVATLVCLENKNNISNAPKLKLFKNIDGTTVAKL